MKKFIVKCVLAVCITVFCLFYLDMMYEQKTDDPIAEVNIFNFIHEGTQISNVGSSHGQYAFNWDYLKDERGLTCFNFALASQSYEYDYSILNMYKNELAEGGIVFIPVSYFSFNSEAVTDADKEALQVRYYRILSPKYNPHYDLYTDLVTIRFPILSAGENFFKMLEPPITFPSLSQNRKNTVYAAEISGNSASAQQDLNNSGVSVVPESSQIQDPSIVYGPEKVAEFESKGYARYQRHFENKSEYFQKDKIEDLTDIIRLCKSKNITPVLITTPYTVYYNQYVSPQFMYDFYSTIIDVATQEGVTYYDYSHDERFATRLEYFGDSDHLNEEGSIYFTNLLMEEIPELKAYLETH